MRARLVPALLTLVVLLPAPVHAGPDEPRGVWPLSPEPEVVHGFEPPPNPYAAGHRGADLAGSPGQAVRTALPGTVAFAGAIGGKPVVTVRHDGRRTTYEPVVASVERGQQVSAGDVLGRLVVPHSHCFPAACLHWGLIEGTGDDETYVDPLTLVGGGPIRLLPLWRDAPTSTRRPWTTRWAPPIELWRRPVDWAA
ncbi:M23 family metallopeptidase [Nocardioides hwasunensis]|uniref:M23 family metallopeptidase n=1 Tax=Nocardioides hwasunensis TaxID=397258 RepID=A0ABR8MBS0_9ACTN|nr:M23 family metallopeptidase [Nocardioides hwasunensis]MBD3913293.1 M23 family metallopeptidase [Nocardioides hwasunensis]